MRGQRFTPELQVFIGIVLVVIGVGLAFIGVGNHVDDGKRHPGTLTVASCTLDHVSKNGTQSWTCYGDVTAADGSFTDRHVGLYSEDAIPQGTTKPVLVAGPAATTAIEPDDVGIRFYGVVGLGALLFIVGGAFIVGGGRILRTRRRLEPVDS